MRNITSFALISVLLLLVSCAKNIQNGDDVPVFSYTEPVVNPPDEFRMVFNTSWVGDRFGTVQFDTTAVWVIEKLGDGRISLFFSNDDDNLPVTQSDTLGLSGDRVYTVIVNNIYTSEFNNFFVGFKKLDLAYEDFEPKF